MSAPQDATRVPWERLSRTKKRSLFALPLLVGVALLIATSTLDRGEPERAKVTSDRSTARATVKDLVETTSFEGTLGFADTRPLAASGQGVLTYAAPEGGKVTRGETLYSINGDPVSLLYGSIPMYRDLSATAEDGRDILQLEKNLVALGYDRDGDIEVDTEWDAGTGEALLRWEEDLSGTEDGRLTLGEIVFLPGARVVGEHIVAPGAQVSPGTQIFSTSQAERIVTLDVEVGDAGKFRNGDEVEVQLPNGNDVGGRVESVGKVAEVADPESGDDPTIEISLSLRGKVVTGGISQSPVDVAVETARERDALSVPIAALMATDEGYAVEVVEGRETNIVPVEPGAFADGWVQIEGADIRPGVEVVVAS